MYDYDFMTPLMVFALIGMTFGVWKIIEIILWVLSHVTITIH